MRLWVNGQLVRDPNAPAISPLDHGLTVGDGVFETVKVVDGTPFALTRHLQRLARSAHGLGLAKPDLDEVGRGVADVLDGWDRPLGRLRITLTAGPGPMGSERGDQPLTVVVGLTGFAPRQASTAAVVVPWLRNERGALTGLEDDVVRRECDGTGLRPRARRVGGPVRQHRGQSVRRHGIERVRGDRRTDLDAAAVRGLPRRGDPRPGARVVWSSGEGPADERAHRRRGDLPDVDHA